jgi:hypothetical protein
MGLNAVVYKNLVSLPGQVQDEVSLVDEVTGELDFLMPELSKLYPEDYLCAVSIRLGNISRIAWLREKIRAKWGDGCKTVQGTILYSGCHSGGTIEGDQLAELKREIEQIEMKDIAEDLISFFESVRQLISASEIEKNPIVFH